MRTLIQISIGDSYCKRPDNEGRVSRKMIPDPGLVVFQLVYPDNRVGKGTTLVVPLKADKDWL